MRRRWLLIGCLSVTLAACGRPPLHVETRRPTPAELDALLALRTRRPPDAARTTLGIRVTPALPQAGQTAVVTCLVPPAFMGGVVVVSVDLHGTSAQIADGAYTRTFGPLSCGTWRATCLVERDGRRQQATAVLDVTAGVCALQE